MDALIVITVIAGGPGYIVAAVLVLTLRLWLGNRGAGWPRIVINCLLLFLVALSLVYATVLFNALLPPGELRTNITRSGLAILLGALPYSVVFSLGPWLLWRKRPGVPLPLAVTPQPKKPEDV